MDQLWKIAQSYGVFAALFVGLLIYLLRESRADKKAMQQTFVAALQHEQATFVTALTRVSDDARANFERISEDSKENTAAMRAGFEKIADKLEGHRPR